VGAAKLSNGTNAVYGQTWYAATAAVPRERPRLSYDIDVDACVIGGGLAGLTAAREIAQRGWTVAVLEAERIAWAASGRNGGCVLPGFAAGNERIIERVGRDRAKALWDLSQAGADYVRRAVREIGMPGVDAAEGWLSVQRIDDAAAIERAANQLQEFGARAEVWPAERVRAVVKTNRYFQGLYLPEAFHIHPLNYALGLAAAAEQAGAQIYEHTPALAIDPAGVRKRIDVPGARVRAGHIVLAGNAHLASLFPRVSRSVVPLASFVGVTEPLGERLHDAIDFRGAVGDTRRVYEYFRVVGGDRLMWGSGISARLSEPRSLKKIIGRNMQRVFPQLGDVEIAHAWAGIMGFSAHKMPQIGEISPGLWVTSAFSGHGLNTTAMAGELIARAILEGDDRWRLFSSYDLVWTGGLIGRAAAQVVFWLKRLRDISDEARRRPGRQQSADEL
jgi:glycine/D-amino acid oxidase-like deaminating enzyme